MSTTSDTTSECSTIMEVPEQEEIYRKKDIDELTISLARRPSVSQIIARKSLLWARHSLEKLPIKLTLGNLGFLAVVLAVMMPRAFTYILVYPIFRLVFGTLYPAYASYKAVRTKNVKEYVKWMMYWIVFALFTCAETFTDVFFSFWFPFYYEIKIILVLWLLSPATKGSSILYRRFVHPALSRREAEIDEALARATEQGYTAVLHLGTRGVNYATTVLMQTAIKNFPNVVPINPQSALPASQSDSAISSLANHRTALTTKESSRVDTTDGIATRASSRRRTRSEQSHSPGPADREPGSISPPSTRREFYEQSTDDQDTSNEEVLHYPLKEENLMIYEEDEEEEEQQQQQEFKTPKQKPKKNQKKERPKPSTRKATLRSFDPEFSDETDLM